MASYTQHYQLHQWEPNDSFLRADFNEDLEKIDTALGEKNGIVFGSYAGDDTTDREIALGFFPSAVLLAINGYYVSWIDNMGKTSCYGGFAAQGMPAMSTGNSSYNIPSDEIVRCSENGFIVHNKGTTRIYSNSSGNTYHYIAFR